MRSQGAYFEGDWGITVLCTMFLVSCIFFNKRLFFIEHGWIRSGQTWYTPRAFIFFTRSFTDECVGCLYSVAIVHSNATVNMGAMISLQGSDFVSFGYTLRSGIAGSYVVTFLYF